jgi:glucose-6-phosphate 1-dehydrogenase
MLDAPPNRLPQCVPVAAPRPRHHAKPPDLCAMVRFGAADDLTQRLVMPALFDLARTKTLSGVGGDDVVMLGRGGLSIATGNAGPRVPAQSNLVADSHDDEGFAKAIERSILHRASPAPSETS